MLNHGKVLLLAIIFWHIFSYAACKKDLPPCTGNCVDVLFAGRAYDKTTNQPLGNVSVEIDLRKGGILTPTTYKIVDGKTDNNGNFKFNTTFDSTLLHQYYVDVIMQSPANYIVSPYSPNYKIEISEQAFFTIDPVGMSSMDFPYYPATNLKINLHRTSAITYPYFEIDASFEYRANYISFTQSANNKDTSFTVITSANIFTKLTSHIHTSATNITLKTDSVKCTANGNNAIDIYY